MVAMKKCGNTLFVQAEKGRLLYFLLDKMAANDFGRILFLRVAEKGRF